MAANSLGLDSETDGFVKKEVKRLVAGLNFYTTHLSNSLFT
jgi:hypothetical protein